MKRTFYLLKTLLVAVGLCVGANAWAVDYPFNVGSSTSDAYGTAFSPEYTLTGDGQIDITFTNYRKTEGNNWENWILMCANSDEVTPTTDLTNKVFTVRSDWYDDKAESNASFTTGGGYTNSDFCTFQNEATVNIRITRIGEAVSVFTTVTKSEDTRWMSYYKTGVTAGTLKFYLTQNLSYLTITDEPTVKTSEAQSVLYTHQVQLGTSGTNHFCQLYGNANGTRSAHWTYGIASSLTADNWVHSFKFNVQQIKGTPSISITGANSAHLNDNSVPTPVYLSLQYDGSTTKYNVVIGTTTLGDQITLTTNAWYSAYLTLLNSDKEQSTLNIIIKNSSSEEVLNTTKVVSTSTLGALEGLTCVHLAGGSNSNGYIDFDDVSIAKYVVAGTCAEPTITITDFDGNARSFTLSCTTDASTIYWSETEKAIGDPGWTEYTGEESTSTATIYAYAATESANSAVVALATEAGSSIQLNTPTILRTGAQTYTITATATSAYNQTATQTIHYTINGGAEQTSSSPASLTNVDGDIVAWATASKFADSEETNMTYVAAITTTCDEWSYNLNSYPSAKKCTNIADAIDDSKTIEISEVTYYNLKGIDCPNLYVSNSSVWLLRNQATAAWKAQNSGTDAKIVIANVKTTDVISFSIALDAGKSYGVTATNATLQYSYNNSEYFYVPSSNGNVILTMPSRAGMAINTIKVSTTLSSVSKTITAAGWATYCSPYALDLSGATGITDAYIVTGATGSTLNLTSVKGGTVPANTGLLMEGAAGTVTIPVVASSSTDVSENKLEGVHVDTEKDAESIYVLMASPKVGFYLNNNVFTVGANTAYLPANFAAARAFYLFDEDATGINAISTTKGETGNYYNLAGQRVAQPTKGLYIVNGKKVVIK